MTIYNTGTLTAKGEMKQKAIDIICGLFPRAFVDDSSVELCEEEGDISHDLKEMVETLYKNGIALTGSIQYYGDYDGGYIVDAPSVEDLTFDIWCIRHADTSDLVKELHRRGIVVNWEEGKEA